MDYVDKMKKEIEEDIRRRISSAFSKPPIKTVNVFIPQPVSINIITFQLKLNEEETK